jgi:N-acetylneuraminic acid mutarotase
MAPVTSARPWRLLVATLALAAGCQAPLRPSTLPPLQGRLDRPMRVQATVADFAPGGLVSLIDPATGKTVSGTVTQADGGFVMAFEPDVQPADGSAYWLEISRYGVTGWIGLRTVVVWSGGRWLSISNGPDRPDDAVLVNTRTTAVSLVWQDSGKAAATVLGRLEGGDWGTGRDAAAVASVQAEVQRLLGGDEDPLSLSSGRVVRVEPSIAAGGETVALIGWGLGQSGTVTIDGTLAAVREWRPDRIVVQLPGSGGGVVQVRPDGQPAFVAEQPVRLGSTWRRWPDLPVAVGGEAVAAGTVQGELFIAGGKDATGKAIGLGWRFQGRTQSWQAIASMPTPRYGMASAVFGDRLYAVGGWTDAGGYSAAVEAYDPQTDSWQRRAPLPRAVLGAAAAVANGRLVVCGGYDGAEQKQTYVYDAITNTWQTRADMPQSRFRHGAAPLGNRVLIAGGRSNGQPTGTASQYDPVADAWSAAPDLPAARSAGTLVSDGQTAWFVDGSDGRPQANLWQLSSGLWVTRPVPAGARAGITGVWTGEEVVVIGGTSGDAGAGKRVESLPP